MLEKYDVVVVGAGTAGCMAAKTLSSKGFDVCLIDRKSSRLIGDKVCGDAIGKHHFDNLGLSYPSGKEKEGDIEGVKVYSPDKSSVFNISGCGLAGFLINRYAFGQRLLKYAVDAGAVLKDMTHVSAPLVEDGYVKGVLATDTRTGEKMKILGDVSIDASGVSAVLRRGLPPEIGVEVNIEKDDIVICYREIRRLKKEVEDPRFCEIYLDQEVAPGGYYWIFPKGATRVNAGLGVSSRFSKANPKRNFYRYILSRDLFESSEIIHKGGGIVPTRRPLDSFVGNGIIVIGDAGCQVNPIHGGGIGPSMMGGKISGEVIAEALEKGDVSSKALWPVNIRFMENYGAKQAGLDIFRIFLQGLTNEELNYGMKYQLITEEDVLKASLGEKIHLNIGEATRRIFSGLGRLGFLRSLYVMARTIREVRSLYDKYPSTPEVFPEWRKNIVEVFERSKRLFWK